ncbi:hypothetical protein K1T71_002912 [Dendrolimus kikuchii]|uniref:Uncharacterized protein n=1 Tax=Dendrolimus kikuchii TaxID=765133 RepID=A0ACC1DAD8_9NEOP|nr:hypothetical protein K1T71_002912 [Dendrolimus kikuchii]
MDQFEDFDLTQEDIIQLEYIEINFLNQSFQVDSDEDVQPMKRKCRRIVLSESENSDDEVSRVIDHTIGSVFVGAVVRLTGDPHGLNGTVRKGSPVSPVACTENLYFSFGVQRVKIDFLPEFLWISFNYIRQLWKLPPLLTLQTSRLP